MPIERCGLADSRYADERNPHGCLGWQSSSDYAGIATVSLLTKLLPGVLRLELSVKVLEDGRNKGAGGSSTTRRKRTRAA